MRAIRLGTRASTLAIAQSQWVADRITDKTGTLVDLVPIRSLGDDLVGPLSKAPQPGVFVSALRDALLAGEVDLVVHSMKDLPVGDIAGITLVATPEREVPHDVFISTSRVSLSELAPGSRVGTSSPRRAAQIRHERPDLDIVDLRGNVDSRIGKVRSGQLDGAVLAAAGITRIGRAKEIDEHLTRFVPAPAQGALAIEVRSSDTELVSALRVLDDAGTRRAVFSERAVLRGLAATCASAVAAFAQHIAVAPSRDSIKLTAEVGGADVSQRPVRCEFVAVVPVGDQGAAEDLGMLAARHLLASGAILLLAHDGWKSPTALPRTVWVTRPATGARADVEALRERGLCVIEAPLIETRADPGASAAALRLLDLVANRAELLAVTSAAALRSLIDLTSIDAVEMALRAGVARGITFAAVGSGTARELEKLGGISVLVPDMQDSGAMLESLRNLPPGVAALPQGNIAMRGLAEGLADLGWNVQAESVYLTESVVPPSGIVDALLAGSLDAVVLRSPSGVRALRDAVGARHLSSPCVLIAGGATTGDYIREQWPDHGARLVVAAAPNPTIVADTAMEALRS